MSRYLGVDAGGSFTRAVVVDLATGEVAEGHAGPANPLVVGPLEASEAIEQAAAGALGQAGCHAFELAGGCIGVAGLARVGLPDGWKDHFDNWGIPGLELVSDLEIAHYGAFFGQPGILVIAGTGSSVMARDPEGAFHIHGGWGWLLGDPGSATDVGRAAIRAALWQAETQEGAPDLGEAICRALGIEDIHRVIGMLHAHARQRQALAGLATVVSRLADDGDARARAVLEDAGERLADVVVAAAGSRFPGESPPVSWSGGMFRSGWFVDAFVAACHGRSPRLEPVTAVASPLAGAVLRAAQVRPDSVSDPNFDWMQRV